MDFPWKITWNVRDHTVSYLLNINGFGEKRVSAVCEAIEQNLSNHDVDSKGIE